MNFESIAAGMVMSAGSDRKLLKQLISHYASLGGEGPIDSLIELARSEHGLSVDLPDLVFRCIASKLAYLDGVYYYSSRNAPSLIDKILAKAIADRESINSRVDNTHELWIPAARIATETEDHSYLEAFEKLYKLHREKTADYNRDTEWGSQEGILQFTLKGLRAARELQVGRVTPQVHKYFHQLGLGDCFSVVVGLGDKIELPMEFNPMQEIGKVFLHFAPKAESDRDRLVEVLDRCDAYPYPEAQGITLTPFIYDREELTFTAKLMANPAYPFGRKRYSWGFQYFPDGKGKAGLERIFSMSRIIEVIEK